MDEQHLFQTLDQYLENTSAASVLWVVDENSDAYAVAASIAKLEAQTKHTISNRFDIAETLTTSSQCALSDYDFSPFQADSFSLIIFRVSKERSLSNHVLDACTWLLANNGQLLLSGKKSEGVKSYFDKCRKQLGFSGEIKKNKDSYLCILSKEKELNTESLDDGKYTTYQAIQNEYEFQSKPGIYGWNKIDAGSYLLVQELKKLKEKVNAKTLLDLGCGYGYLSVMASKILQPDSIFATDNNITATKACELNLENHFSSRQFHVSADDCGKNIQTHFDLIICNPPFHQGSSHNFNLTEKFLQAAHRMVKGKGHCLFVFNAFVPAEKIANTLFKSSTLLVNNKQYKVYLYSKH